MPQARLDKIYHQAPFGQVGPLQKIMEGFGRLQEWVVGSFQELGQDLHELLENLADDKLRARGFAKGRYESGREVSSCMVAAKAVSFCLLGKVSKLGQPSAELGPSMGRREGKLCLGRKRINP